MSSFQGLYDVIRSKGLFSSFYTDRGSHYWLTPEAGGKVDKQTSLRLGVPFTSWALSIFLRIRLRHGGDPRECLAPCRGACPRNCVWPGSLTWMRRTRFLTGAVYLATQQALCPSPEEPGSAFVPFTGSVKDILCVQEERVVGNDNTVRFKKLVLQIPEDRHRHHYVKARVRVHQYLDESLAIFHGPRQLASYDKTESSWRTNVNWLRDPLRRSSSVGSLPVAYGFLQRPTETTTEADN